MSAVFVKSPAGWNKEFHTWGGELGKWMSKKTVQVQVGGQARAPVKTGATKASIRFNLGYSGGELESTVSAGTPQALWVHEGTARHVIRPNQAPALVFFWAKAGRVVNLQKVNHPGIRNPKPFLTDSLKAAFRGV